MQHCNLLKLGKAIGRLSAIRTSPSRVPFVSYLEIAAESPGSADIGRHGWYSTSEIRTSNCWCLLMPSMTIKGKYSFSSGPSHPRFLLSKSLHLSVHHGEKIP